MKVAVGQVHLPAVEQILATEHGATKPEATPRAALEVAQVYEHHADFLWRSLQHMGIRDADLEDAIQEVMVVVHRRRQSYGFECRLTTWLFGICLRVASRHRRRAYFRWERPTETPPELIDPSTPYDRLVEQRAKSQLEQLLCGLSPEHRAAFALFEIEGQSCQQIADLFGVPVGTIYSRLNAARKLVDRALLRQRGRSSNGKGIFT